MAWTSPATWSVGEVPTAAKMNAHIRDNLVDLGQPGVGYLTFSSTQSFPTSGGTETYTQLAFDSMPITKNCHVTSNRFYVDQAGTWEFCAMIRWPSTASANASSLRWAKIYANGSATDYRDIRFNFQNFDTICTVVTGPITLSSGAYVDLRGAQSHGSNLTLTSAGTYLYGRIVYR